MPNFRTSTIAGGGKCGPDRQQFCRSTSRRTHLEESERAHNHEDKSLILVETAVECGPYDARTWD